MFENIKIDYSHKNFMRLIMVVVVLTSLGYFGFRYFLVSKALQETKNSFSTKEEEFKKLETENTQLSDLLQAEKNRNNELNKQVDSISGKLGILQKLSQTDRELLQKYSRVYFLSENYSPDKLVSIDEKYLYEKNKENLIHAKVQKFLYSLLNDAEENNTPLLVISAYRSFGEQAALKSGYLTTYGSGANKFSADQGYSEHQLGTAIDFTTPSLKASFGKIESTSAYGWLLKNAHKYGFILSYPRGNSYYQFEPWHWRFVGVALASDLHDRNMNFYDMSQREIDTYLVDIFD